MIWLAAWVAFLLGCAVVETRRTHAVTKRFLHESVEGKPRLPGRR